jgi:PAS domain S-box-containing protein
MVYYAETTIRVGAYENPPKIYTTKEGSVAGFWPEITQLIAAEEGWKMQWVPGTWQQCLERLDAGEIDLMVDVAKNPQRDNILLFCEESALVSWSTLYAARDVEVQSLLDLQGKTVGGLQESVNLYGEGGLMELAQQFEITFELQEFENYLDVFGALQTGEIDVGVTNKDFGALHYVAYDVQASPVVFQPAKLYFAMPQNAASIQIKQKIDSNLKKMKQNPKSGYYDAIHRYLHIPEHVVVFPFWIQVSLGLLLLIAAATIYINRLLRKRVEERTRALKEDIEKRKAAEEQLLQREKDLKILIDNQLDLLVKVDIEGRFLFVSPSYCEMFGLSEEQLLGKTFMPLVHPDDAYPTEEAMQNLYNPPYSCYLEQRAKTARGWRWLAWKDRAILDENGEVIEIIGLGRDITEQKENEEELRSYRDTLEELVKQRTKELETKNAELERMNNLFIGREFRIKELRDQIKTLKERIAEMER